MPTKLLGIDSGNRVEILTMDGDHLFAALFALPPHPLDSTCSPKSWWVRVAKDGSSSSQLGDAASCYSNGTTAVVLGESLYWLAFVDPGPSLPLTTNLMAIPKSGGTTTRVATFDKRTVLGLGTDGVSLFAVDIGNPSSPIHDDGAVLRVAVDSTVTTLATSQRLPRWIGVIGTDVFWSTPEDCIIDQNCKSLAVRRIPAAGGGGSVLRTLPLSYAPIVTISNGAIVYFDAPSEVHSIHLDGTETIVVGGIALGVGSPLTGLRVVGDEVIISDERPRLHGWPRDFVAPTVLDTWTFEVDERYDVRAMGRRALAVASSVRWSSEKGPAT